VRTTTFPALLDQRLRADAGRPLVTFYDDATGERVELSVATYANWVSKTASLAQDELELERGMSLLLDLPTHWLGAVWLGAAWTLGLCATDDVSLEEEAQAVVCGPAGVGRYAAVAGQKPVLALSLRPLGGRFTDPLPAGVVDYGAVVLAQPDVFSPADPPGPDDLAWRDVEAQLSHADLLGSAAGAALVEEGGRLLTDVNPCSRRGLDALVSPLLRGGGTIWVANPEVRSWQHRYDEERATASLGPTTRD
jgi:uncharacterized protein (TIGR03089 family)